jgi:hypothetical protein
MMVAQQAASCVPVLNNDRHVPCRKRRYVALVATNRWLIQPF